MILLNITSHNFGTHTISCILEIGTRLPTSKYIRANVDANNFTWANLFSLFMFYIYN